jgi:hypothetical protein
LNVAGLPSGAACAEPDGFDELAGFQFGVDRGTGQAGYGFNRAQPQQRLGDLCRMKGLQRILSRPQP